MFQNIYPIKTQDSTYSFEYNIIPKELNEAEFQENKFNLIQILTENKYRNIFIYQCKNKMCQASSNLKYNAAIVYRDIIENLEYIYHIKNNHNNYNYPHLLLGETIDNGYKLFFVSHNLITLKRKYSELNEEAVMDFVRYGKELNKINLISNEKRNLDFKGIVSSDLRNNEFKHLSLIDHDFAAREFIQGLLKIKEIDS